MYIICIKISSKRRYNTAYNFLIMSTAYTVMAVTAFNILVGGELKRFYAGGSSPPRAGGSPSESWSSPKCTTEGGGGWTRNTDQGRVALSTAVGQANREPPPDGVRVSLLQSSLQIGSKLVVDLF
jgi:hypothetical protein